MANINTMRADVMQAFGQTAQPIEHPIQREEIMSFSKSGVRLNFNLNAYWDEAKGVYQEPVPAISFSYNKKYCSIPTDAETLNELSKFLAKVAKVCKGLPEKDYTVIHDDTETAEKMLQKYKVA